MSRVVSTRVRTTAPPAKTSGDPLLAVEGLSISFGHGARSVEAVRDVSFEVGRGEFVGVVGESGSGKSVTALAIMGLLDPRAARVTGSARLEGTDLLRMKDRELRRIRGAGIGMVFQEPMTALDPVFTVGHQLTETLTAHEKISRSVARRRAIEMFEAVGIPDPELRFSAYPHQLSGGLRQRAMIAIALSCNPKLIIADEPTTAVDVTVQAQLLDLLDQLRRERGTSIVLITHDIGVIAESCERVLTMYAGEIVEAGAVDDVLAEPAHPYTVGLLGAQPSLLTRGKRLVTIPGSLPRPDQRDQGCLFAPRCPATLEPCVENRQVLETVADGHAARCWRAPALLEISANRVRG
ncbi:MAG: dppD [Pseudonocardiales bacterium]|nr:dppD [Pseudonocardiales bacterium]